MKQAAEGMENLASAGFSTSEIISAMPGLLNLAASSGESLASSSDIAASTLRGFGLEANQAGHVADVLAKNANATNAAVADTGEAMKYIAPVAHSMGLSLEEVTAAIGELANSGIQGSQAGTTLRSALTRLASPSKEAAGAMESIGFSAFDSQGKLKGFSTIIDEYNKALQGKTDQQKQDLTATIFGQEAMSGMLVLMQGGKKGLDDLTESYKASDGAAKDMATTMQDNAKSAIEQMTGSLETAGIKVEEAFAPAITDIANKIQELANNFSDLTPEQQKFYGELLIGAAAAGPLLKLIGGLTSGIGGLIKVSGDIKQILGLGSVAAEGEKISGTVAALSKLAPVLVPVTAGIVGLAAVMETVSTANDIMSKSIDTSTEDLGVFERIINSLTGNTVKSKEQLQAAGLVYKNIGETLGDDFKKKVEDSTKAIGEFSMFLSNINFDNTITDDETSQFNQKVNTLVDQAIKAIKSRQSEVQTEMSKLFMSDDNTLDDTENQVLQALNAQGDDQIKKVTDIQGEIQKIYSDAIKARGHLTDEERQSIKDRYTEISQIELAAQKEAQDKQAQAYLKYEFANRANNLSADDASALLKEQKKKLDDQRVKSATNYDVNIDTLKQLKSTQTGAAAEATQAEIDKFTEKKNKVIQLENEQWKESIATIERENPKLVGAINEYTGEVLTNKDKERTQTLQLMKDTYTGLTGITESGMYRLKNVSTGGFEDVYVTVDKTTGDIVGAYGQATGQIGGYTEQMAEDAKSSAQNMTRAYEQIKQSLDNTKSATVDSNGELLDSNGKVIAQLGEMQTATDGTTYRILNLNGNPIKIETNSDGTVKDLDGVKQSVDNIPLGKNIETSTNASETSGAVDNLSGSVNRVPEYHQTVFEAIFKGWETLKQYLPFIGDVSVLASKKDADNNYTGTNSPQTGLSYVNEHGYETAKGSNVKMINSGLAYISSHATGGDGINDHMTTVNEMQNDINNSVNNKLGSTVAKLLSASTNQIQELKKITQNTGQSADAGIKNIELNEKLANNLVNAFNSSSNSGSFSSLNTELEMANTAKDKASKMKVDDNTNYASLKSQVDSIKADIDDLDTTIDNTTDESTKKQLEAQKKVLKAKQDSVEKEMDLAKMVAENEIQNAKDSADQQVKIAEEKKDKLTKIAEAVTTAIENQLKAEDAAAEKTINNKLTKLESNYNKKLAALEEESTQTSRSDTEQDYNNKIAVLKTKMNNTASFADKQAYQLQINDLQKELSKQQDEWNTDDKKKALEDEYNKQKDTLEKQLQNTKDYYSKLEETDSVNAQARYILLNGSNQDLVDLLNSYNPQWQNAGQSLTDSLLTGLNSNKQTVQEAVGELVQIRSGKEYGSDSDSGTYTYYDTASQTTKIGHYSTGTNSNPRSGLYYTNENDFEMSSKGDVAYVSQGAAIKNHMQTQAYIDSLIATEVSNLKASLIQSQQDTIRSMFGSIGGSSNNVINKEGNKVIFQVENYNQYTNSDVEATANALGYYAFKEQRN